MASILGSIGNAAGNVISRVKDTWKKMPREQKAETLTTLGLAAAAAFSKPKSASEPVPSPMSIGNRVPQPGDGPGPQVIPFTAPPQPGDASESKFAKKMRRNFGR